MRNTPDDSSDWFYSIFDKETPADGFGVFAPFVRLWHSKRVEGALPAWRDFELSDLRDWWGWVSVCDIAFDPVFDTVYRLWGTNVTEILGYDMTGNSPRLNRKEPFTYAGGYSQVEFDYLERLVRESAIGITQGTEHWEQRDHIEYREITLPLADDGRTVDKLIFVIDPVKWVG